MKLQTEISESIQKGTGGEYHLTMVFRKIEDEGDAYWVAECLELPGCVSQGMTEQEAQANIHDAVRSCLSVIFEDTLKEFIARQSPPDYTGIAFQERMRFSATPCLESA